jgi:sensor histidine kinase YesM
MSLFGTFTFVFLLVASWRLQVLAKKITMQIVRLFETLEQITQSGVQFVQLKFKKQSRELNKLSLNFNKVAKTI